MRAGMGLLTRNRNRNPSPTPPTPETRTAPAETRDPRAATINTRWTAPGAPMIPEWDAETAIRFAYVANVYVWRCVQVRANAVAGLPFRAGLDPSSPADVDPNAPLARLLGPPPGGPSRTVSARRLWAWTVAQRLTTGRFGWELENPSPSSNKVVGLWPLAAHLLEPIPSQGGSRYFDGFYFGRKLRDGGSRRILTPDQVLYDWIPGQLDFREPESPLQAARLDISVAVMQDRYDHAFLRNDARPAAIMVHEEFAELDEREAFRQQFDATHRGPDNAGKMAFVEATAGNADINRTFHIETLGLSQRDGEFIARYEQKIRAICLALGTPLSILGDASGRTYSNAGAEWRNWWETTMLPDLADLQDAINMQLAPRLGSEVGWFDLSEVAALKSESRIVALGAAGIQLVANGMLSVNEWRAEYDLPSLDGGDTHTVTGAGMAADQAPTVDQTPTVIPPPAAAPAPPARWVAAFVETRAAASEGAMVALKIPVKVANKLALADGEPADGMHITLAYLGKAAKIDRGIVQDSLNRFAWPDAPLTGTIGGGGGRFQNGDPDGDPIWAQPDIPGLAKMRTALVDHLHGDGIDVADDHGFTPHVTLAYVAADAPTPDLPAEKYDVSFSSVHLAHGGNWSEHSLMRVQPKRSPVVAETRDIGAEQRAEHSRAQAARWTAVDSTTRLLETKWVAPMTRVLADAGREAAANLAGMDRHKRPAWTRRDHADLRADPTWATTQANGLARTLLDRDALETAIIETATPLYGTVVRSASAHLPAPPKRDTGITTGVGGRPPRDVNAAIERIVKTRATRLAGLVADTTVQIMRSALAEGIAEGESIPKLAARVGLAMGGAASKKRAVVIARTETISAFNNATRELAVERDVADQFEWISTLDQRTRPDHADANGQTIDPDGLFDVGGEHLAFPGDPNGSPGNVIQCLTGDTQVIWPGQKLKATTKRSYSGTFVKLTTARGHVLTATPNHPILTPLGYVAASSLRPGDQVIASRSGVLPGSGEPQVGDVPATIEEVHRSFSKSNVPTRVVGRSVDFHGDGIPDEEVEVVGTNGELRDWVKPSGDKGVEDREFVRAEDAEAALPSLGGAQHPSVSNLDAGEPIGSDSGVVGGAGESLALGLGHAIHADVHALAGGTDRQTQVLEADLDSPSRDAEMGAKRFDAHALTVETSQFVHVDGLAPMGSGQNVGLRFAASGDSEIITDERDRLGTDAEVLTHLLECRSLGMEPCELVSVEHFASSGHVFNLSTSDNWYIGNGIAQHNCRCTIGTINEFTPRMVDPDDVERLLTEVSLGRRDAADTIALLREVTG